MSMGGCCALGAALGAAWRCARHGARHGRCSTWRFGRRFGRRMAMLDKPNRSTWQLLSASSTLRHDDGVTQHAAHRLAAAVAFLQAVLGHCSASAPSARHARTTRSSTCMHLHACTHDAELHLHALACTCMHACTTRSSTATLGC
jgi:hypothetical protein